MRPIMEEAYEASGPALDEIVARYGLRRFEDRGPATVTIRTAEGTRVAEIPVYPETDEALRRRLFQTLYGY